VGGCVIKLRECSEELSPWDTLIHKHGRNKQSPPAKVGKVVMTHNNSCDRVLKNLTQYERIVGFYNFGRT
jgi:hypothetical protein